MSDNEFDEKELSEQKSVEEMPMTETAEDETTGLEPDLDNQQPVNLEAKPRKKRRSKWVWLGILIFVLLIALGVVFGYRNGVQRRLANEKAILMEQISLQLEWTYKDMDAGRYENAKARLDYIIEKYPEFPGIEDLMAQVIGKMNEPVPTPTQIVIATIEPGVTATPDFRGGEEKFAQLTQHIDNEEWDLAVQTVQSLKENNFDYRTIEVDGLYFIALRNRGIQRIWAGELEQGMYDLTVAAELGALDSQAAGAESWATTYLTGASYWDINWPGAVEIFGQLYAQSPYFSDSTGMTTAERYRIALYRLGDLFAAQGDYCTASSYYSQSLAVGANLDIQVTATAYAEACANPTPTPGPPEEQITPTPPEPTENPEPTEEPTVTP
jgi:tetratricopeptide (TPR) repeat protein